MRFEFICDRPYWFAPEADIYLQFAYWEPPQPPANKLSVPELSKAKLSSNLVVLPSVDGAKFDAHVVVPGHLDAQSIANQLVTEIRRLKALDEARAPECTEEYLEEDLIAITSKLGCLWVTKPITLEECWD